MFDRDSVIFGLELLAQDSEAAEKKREEDQEKALQSSHEEFDEYDRPELVKVFSKVLDRLESGDYLTYEDYRHVVGFDEFGRKSLTSMFYRRRNLDHVGPRLGDAVFYWDAAKLIKSMDEGKTQITINTMEKLGFNGKLLRQAVERFNKEQEAQE